MGTINYSTSEIIDIAIERGLSVKEITYGMNGYPSNLGDRAVIGFDSFEDAEKFASEFGGIISHFETKNGWRFWNNRGEAYKAYSFQDYLNDLGDNYYLVDESTINDHIKKNLHNLVEDFDGDFKSIVEYIEYSNDLLSEIEWAGYDEVVITNNYSFSTIKKTMMGYHEDNTSYAIGVLIEK